MSKNISRTLFFLIIAFKFLFISRQSCFVVLKSSKSKKVHASLNDFLFLNYRYAITANEKWKKAGVCVTVPINSWHKLLRALLHLTLPNDSLSPRAGKTGTWRQAVTGTPQMTPACRLASMACPACSLIQARHIYLEVTEPPGAWVLSHQPLILKEKNAPRLAHRPVSWR